MNAVPLSVPVVLSPGHFESPNFKVRVSTQHVVSIALKRSLPPDQMDCFIDMNLMPNGCANHPAILNVKWQLVSGGHTIATGSSNERGASYSDNLIERHIGRFDAQSGKEYKLEFDVLQDGSGLAPAHPLLEVVPNLNAYEGRLMLAGVGFYAGFVIAAIGVIMAYRSAFGA